MDSNHADLVSKAEKLLADVKNYNGDRLKRYALMKQTELLYLDLEDGMDSMLRQWTFINTVMSLNTMVELGAFENIPKEGSITAKELGARINLEESVIVRIMRMLTGTGIIALTGEDTYAHTPKSLPYCEGGAVEFWRLCINFMACYMTFPEYFKSKTPEDLIDLRKTPYSCAYGREGKTFYEVLTETPERFNMFNKAMMQQEASLPTLGMFPFVSLKQQVEAEPERVFVVDIGGGRGQSLLLIQKETSGVFSTSAKMILQDRPVVLDSIPQESIPGIEKMPHDFYTPQPVKNAHIYYLRRIIHNYQDGVCIAILKNVAAAMGPTSRCLIAEIVIPPRTEVGEDMGTYWMDMVMLGIGGKERSKKEFIDILEPAGLQLVKVWPNAVGTQSVLETKLKGN